MGCTLLRSIAQESTCVLIGNCFSRPLAGTRRRGKSLHEDAALEEDLLADDKERSEHIMLVDLGRNDVGKVSL